MAGFDAEFSFNPGNLEVVRALHAASRRRARAMDLRWQSQATEAGYGYVAIHGWTWGIDFLLERLRRDLPTIAEAAPGLRSPAYRRRLGNGYVDIATKFRCGWYERYGRDSDAFVPTLRAIQTPSVLPIHDLWPASDDHELGNRLMVSQTVMAAWCVDEIDPEVVLEELHTAAELMLKRITGMPDRTKFPDLVKAARRQKILGSDPLTWQYRDPRKAMTPQQLLKSLVTERNETKHGGKSAARAWLEIHFGAVSYLLVQLSAKV